MGYQLIKPTRKTILPICMSASQARFSLIPQKLDKEENELEKQGRNYL